MKSKLKNSILLICLNESFGKSLSKSFADSLSMHFADCKELVEYDLFNSGQILSECGKDYYLMREKKVVMMTCGYENTVMFADYDIFNHNKEVFNNRSTTVFLKVPKQCLTEKDMISLLAFDIRDSELEKECDITVNIKKLNEKSALNEIYRVLGELK